MAIRLNVVMVHSPPAIPGAQQLAESIVGELIGRPGIDVALVGSLDGIAGNSTDALTLESITGDVAVLDWRSPPNLIEALAALQFSGIRASHANDSECEEPTVKDRKIYAFDLQTNTNAKQLCNDLQTLLASRRVQTFAIGGMDSEAQRTPKQPPSARSEARQESRQPSFTPEQVDDLSDRDKPPVASSSPTKTEIDLDDLVDQLDQLDP